MKWFVEMAPVAIFVVAYFFYPDLPATWTEQIGEILFPVDPPSLDAQRIYFGTLVLMIAMVLQCAVLRAMNELRGMHKAALVLVWIFGGLTLLLQDPVFIKWKPTILYWGAALVFSGSLWIGGRNLVEKMLSPLGISLEPSQWQHLNLIWISFFALCGALNLYVAFACPEEFWVQFKFFGLAIAAPLLFLVVQGLYLGPKIQSSSD